MAHGVEDINPAEVHQSWACCACCDDPVIMLGQNVQKQTLCALCAMALRAFSDEPIKNGTGLAEWIHSHKGDPGYIRRVLSSLEFRLCRVGTDNPADQAALEVFGEAAFDPKTRRLTAGEVGHPCAVR